jgi:ubiquinol-cytochrome c reductase cytochrome b subunit
MRKPTRPDHWSLLFGQITAYAFLVLLVTGAFLTVFYKPDMTQVAYQGSYSPLRDVPVSRAYDSTLKLSLDVRGGLLIRQVHHWAALIFVSALCLELLRRFFTGAFRSRWLIWVTLLPLAMVASLSGTILPDDMLSGGSLGLLQGVLQSIPVVGTELTFWLFGGDFPGTSIIPLMYWLHVLVLPVAIIGLAALLWRRAGRRLSAGLFFTTCGVLTFLGTFVQINPIWQLGPYHPGDVTAGAVPGWYMGFLDGAIRIMPGWEVDVAGHPLTLAVLVPALIVPGAFFTFLAAYPLLERRFSLARIPVGAAGIAFYGLLWAAAANDQIAHHFNLSLYAVTWFFRFAVFVGPVLAFVLTRWICLGLADRKQEEAEHGRETGRIEMSPEGGFTEITERVPTG